MKNYFKLLTPSYIKDVINGLIDIINYNIADTRLPNCISMICEHNDIILLVKLCFGWLVEEILPTYLREAAAGHIMTIEECEFGEHELDPNFKHYIPHIK